MTQEVAVISTPQPPPNLPCRCSTFRLSLATGLTFCLVCAELSVGHHSRCLTLLALSDQTVYNLLTLIVALVANQLGTNQRQCRSQSKTTYGWSRVSAVGAVSALVFLSSLNFTTTVECLQSLLSDYIHDHHGGMKQTMSFMVVVLAATHFVTYVAVFAAIGGYTFTQSAGIAGCEALQGPAAFTSNGMPRMRGRQKHFLLQIPYRFLIRDLAGCFFTLVTSLSVYAIERELERSPATKYIDSVVALLSIVSFLVMSYPILKGTTLLLLQTIPADIKVDEIKCELTRRFPQILGIHEMHVWSLSGRGSSVATLHAIFSSQQSYIESLPLIQKYLLSEQSISQLAIQPEIDDTRSSSQCLSDCKSELCLLQCKGNLCKGCCPTS